MLTWVSFVAVLILFYGFGYMVRRGIVTGRSLLLTGGGVGIAAMGVWYGATYFTLPPAARNTPLVLIGPGMMGICALISVASAYRMQKVTDVATYQTGDTKIIVRSCIASRIPDADTLVLPTSTNLRMVGGLVGPVGVAAGAPVEREAITAGPVGMGKVIVTAPGRLAVGRILHVAVYDALKPVDEKSLRRGMENAAQQARKAGDESIAVLIGPLRGLPLEKAADAIAGGILKYRHAFAEIVFIVLEPRYSAQVASIVEKAVASASGEARETTIR